MLESLINSLDQRGIIVLQALIGRRAIELLEAEQPKEEKKSTLLLPNTPPLVANTEILKG